jgi:hypothetical protein
LTQRLLCRLAAWLIYMANSGSSSSSRSLRFCGKAASGCYALLVSSLLHTGMPSLKMLGVYSMQPLFAVAPRLYQLSLWLLLLVCSSPGSRTAGVSGGMVV